jgi:hypothetical protein
MNSIIQAATVLAAFAAAHERFIELIRSFNDRLSATERWWQPIGAWVDRHTIGPGNVIIAIGMAFATQANLLALFHASTKPDSPALFFDLFMTGHPFSQGGGLSPPALVVGYILMGLTTGLGADFWHNAAKGLVDFRQQLQGVTAKAAPQGVPAEPSALFVVPSSAGLNAPTPVVGPSRPGPAPSPPTDAFVVT